MIDMGKKYHQATVIWSRFFKYLLSGIVYVFYNEQLLSLYYKKPTLLSSQKSKVPIVTALKEQILILAEETHLNKSS